MSFSQVSSTRLQQVCTEYFRMDLVITLQKRDYSRLAKVNNLLNLMIGGLFELDWCEILYFYYMLLILLYSSLIQHKLMRDHGPIK